MKKVILPETLVLCDGTSVKLAPLAMNANFTTLIQLTRQANADAVDVIEAVKTCICDCMHNGDKEVTDEQIKKYRELIPSNFIVGLLTDEEAN